MSLENLTVTVLDTKFHHRNAFFCGVEPLDTYLHRYAKQHVKTNISRVFVATNQDAPQEILGFYSLSAAEIERLDLPDDTSRKLPPYPVPVAIIGRLAVDIKWKGQGIGAYLLINAFMRVLRASETLGVFAVIVDAKDENATKFYQKYGFLPLENQSNGRLFLELSTIEKMRYSNY